MQTQVVPWQNSPVVQAGKQALITQSPPVQVWPVPQTGPEPQAQAPEGPQLSARVVLHAVQTDPPVPQAANDFDMQAPAPQQPKGHVAGLQAGGPQTPALQVWSTPQHLLPQTVPAQTGLQEPSALHR
jgi:hypothetical protein